VTTPMTVEELQAAAARGAVWLDQVCDGWWEEATYRPFDHKRIGGIELDDLDMSDPRECVGGQLEERWGQFLYEYQFALDDVGEDAEFQLGFDTPHLGGSSLERYAILTEAWKSEIRRRRAERRSA
jgi:hypothetical protein